MPGVEVIDAGPLLVTVLMGGLNVLVIRVRPHLARDHRVCAAALLIITSSHVIIIIAMTNAPVGRDQDVAETLPR